MTTDWNKLTVVELRGELKKRGLVQTGKKADLVERLTSSEDEPSDDVNRAEEANDAAIEAQPAGSPPSPEPNVTASDTVVEAYQEPAALSEEPTIEEPEPIIATNVDAPAQVEMTAPINVEPATDTILAQIPTESTVSVALDEEVGTAGEALPAVGEIIQDIQSRKRRSRTPSVDDGAARKRARQDGADSGMVDTDMLSGDEMAGANIASINKAEDSKPEISPADANQEFRQDSIELEQQDSHHELGKEAEGQVQPSQDQHDRSHSQFNSTKQQPTYTSDDITMEDVQERAGTPGVDGHIVVEAADHYGTSRDNAHDTAEADFGADERPVVPAMHPATSALYIKNLMRPLRDSVVEDYLLDLATPPSQQPDPNVIVEFYLDSVKSHAFVQFNSISAASRVRSALHGQVWPDERNRKALWVDFIPPEHVRDWIDREQAVAQGRGNFTRFEVVYEADDSGDFTARLEELGPETARQSARPPPTGPAAAAAAAAAAAGIPTGPSRRGFGVEGAPLGPRGSGGRMVPPYRQQGGVGGKLDEGWKQTQAYPQLLYKPAPEELALRRIDNMRSYYTTDKYRDMGKEDEINRYTFENNDSFVDRGREVFIGIRPPHREAERRRGGAGAGTYGGGRRGPPPQPSSGSYVDRYVGGRGNGRDDFTPRSRFNGAPLPTFDPRPDRRGRMGGYRR